MSESTRYKMCVFTYLRNLDITASKALQSAVSEIEMNLSNYTQVLIILVVISMISMIYEGSHHFYQANSLGLEPPQSKEEPIINDPDLKIELVVEGLELPTSMAFLGYNDFLVLEKEAGGVMRIINGTLSEKPLLDLNVATEIDRGLLGVSIHDSFGNIYVTDWINSNIQKFTNNGKFITKWGSNGTDNGEFNYLEDIEVDSSDNIYVVDAGNNQIQKFDSNGKFITKWGSNGTSDSEFIYPWGIAIDSQDNVYVSDTEKSEVQKFTNNGKFITKWGSNGTNNGEFYGPEGIAVDLNGNVYIADAGNDRIQKFSLGKPVE